MRDAERRGMRGSAEDAARLADLVPETVVRSVLVRLDALPAAAGDLARAAAVLGPDARASFAATLAGLELDKRPRPRPMRSPPRTCSSRTESCDSPTRSCGPRSRSRWRPLTVADGTPRRPGSSRRRGTDPERRSAHLLIADPTGDLDVVEVLRESARSALARGAARAAVTYLERALEEPPGDASRPGLLEELGTAAAEIAADPRAEGWLREAYEAATEPVARGRCALALGRSLFFAGRPDEALAAIDAADPDLGGWRAEDGVAARGRVDRRGPARSRAAPSRALSGWSGWSGSIRGRRDRPPARPLPACIRADARGRAGRETDRDGTGGAIGRLASRGPGARGLRAFTRGSTRSS